MALRGLPQAAERTTVASVCSVEDAVLSACERAERFNQERLYLHKPNTAQTSRLSTRMHLGEHTADQHTSSAGSALSSSTNSTSATSAAGRAAAGATAGACVQKPASLLF